MTFYQHTPILAVLGVILALHVAGYFSHGILHKILSAACVVLHGAAVVLMLYFGVDVKEALAVMLASSIIALALGLLSVRHKAEDTTKEGEEA